MSDEPQAAPERSWLPLAIAGAIAVVVVVGAIVVSNLRAGMGPAKTDAVRACEEAYAASATEGEPQPAIVAGDVFAAAEWRGLWDFLEEQGVVGEPSDEQAAALDEAAAARASEGRDVVTVVWWLDSDEHLQCTVEVAGDVALDATARVGALSAPA